MKHFSYEKMVTDRHREVYKSLGIFLTLAVYIFGAGVLYQKTESNSDKIDAIVDSDIRDNYDSQNLKRDIREISERIARLEAKIDALDEWCRKNLKKK